jgi:uncharacterized protein YcnI
MHSFLRACVLGAPLALAAAPVAAHVVADPNEGPAGGYFRTALRITHGCGDSATIAVRVKIPDGVVSAKPQAKPGWTIEIVRRSLDKPVAAGHGQHVSAVVDEIVWRGGRLPADQFDEFGLALKLPEGAGRTLYFRTVQECEAGALRWTAIPKSGEKWGDLETPAPFVRLVPAQR